MAHQELTESDALLRDKHCSPFRVRRIIGANDPEVLTQTVKVQGWKPVNTKARISDPQGVIERLGGRQLYGDDPNQPFLYDKSVDHVWSVLREMNMETPIPRHQKQMLAPVGNKGKIYGFCGLDLSTYSDSTFPSIGGLISNTHRNYVDAPYWGVLDYEATTANRIASSPAVPRSVLEAWAKDQIKRAIQLDLDPGEREAAAASLGEATGDVRPLFF